MDQFSVSLLGDFTVYHGDRHVTLVCAKFWPNVHIPRAVASLRSALWRLRPVGAGPLLTVDRAIARDPRVVMCVDDPHPPYSFVQIQGIAQISEDPQDLLDIATRTGGRYMGADRAEEYKRRNGVPGELVIRIRPTKVRHAFDLAN